MRDEWHIFKLKFPVYSFIVYHQDLICYNQICIAVFVFRCSFEIYISRHMNHFHWVILCIFWLCWVFVAPVVSSLVVSATLQLQRTVFSSPRLLLLQSRGSRAHRLQQLWHVGSPVVVPRLQSTGLLVTMHRLRGLWHVGTFWIRERTHVSCLGWQILH